MDRLSGRPIEDISCLAYEFAAGQAAVDRSVDLARQIAAPNRSLWSAIDFLQSVLHLTPEPSTEAQEDDVEFEEGKRLAVAS